MAYDAIFSPLDLPHAVDQEPHSAFEHRRAGSTTTTARARSRASTGKSSSRGAASGAIISSFVPVHPRGRILPNYATIVSDDRIPFWRAVGEAVHAHDCKYILQLSHGGRQRDIATIDYPIGLSSTGRKDPLHGFECEAMTLAEIRETVQAFAEGARRARDAGLDGVELHGANGYLITQFLSSAINDRTDDYGGVLANRARFVREIVQAIRARVGRDFHLQMKISATEFNDALLPDEGPGNTINDSTQVCRWLVEDGVDAIHVSSGSAFPHPKNPAGDFPIDEIRKTYDSLISSGVLTLRNYLLFSGKLTGEFFKRRWESARGPSDRIEGLNLPDARAIKQAVGPIPVICTGGFQTAAIIEDAIRRGDCDAVSIARSLIANNDLVQQFARGIGRPEPGRAPTAIDAWSMPRRTLWGATTSRGFRRARR